MQIPTDEQYQAADVAAFERFFAQMKSRGLVESKWRNAATASFDEIWSHPYAAFLWEGIVAEYVAELGFVPKRLPATKTNLDFDLSSSAKALYAECVVPKAGDKANPHSVHQFAAEDFEKFEWSLSDGTKLPFQFADHDSTVQEETGRFGLRIVNALTQKNRQITDFFEGGAEAASAIVFLNTICIGNTYLSSTRSLSPVVSSLFGSDGVPTFHIDNQTGKVHGAVIQRSPTIAKGGSSVGRDGFYDRTLINIAAVVHLARCVPLNMIRRSNSDAYDFANFFVTKSELILNPTATYPLSDELVRRFHCNILVTSAPDQKDIRIASE